jgi:hypothetical protein
MKKIIRTSGIPICFSMLILIVPSQVYSSSYTTLGPVLWNFSVVAVSGSNQLSDPALDKSNDTGKWQVAFSKWGQGFGGGYTSPYIDASGVYLQEIGGALTTIAKPGDETPNQTGYIFCDPSFFPICPDLGLNYRVSLSQGNVAFIAGSFKDNATLTGVYVGDGKTLKRIADQTTIIPNSSSLFNSFGIAPSIDNGKVVIKGADVAINSVPTLEGVYADFGNGLEVIADKNSTPLFGYGYIPKLSGFGEAPSLTSTYHGEDIVAFIATADLGSSSSSNIRGVYTRSPSTDPLVGWGIVADSKSTFPYNKTSLTSPAIDFSGLVAFQANVSETSANNPTGIYAGPSADSANCCPEQIATTALIPPEGGIFKNFGIFSSIDASPRQLGAESIQHWVTFTAETDNDSGVYLRHDKVIPNWPTFPPESGLYKIIGAQGIKQLLAPILHFDPTEFLPVTFNLFHDAVKDGAVAFRVSLPGKDAIILAGLCAADLNTDVSVSRGGFRLNRTTKRYVQQVTIKNTGTEYVNGPIALGLDGLSANASLTNMNNSCGLPAVPNININLGADNVLSPGETVSVVLEFSNSTNKPIAYTPRMLLMAPNL